MIVHLGERTRRVFCIMLKDDYFYLCISRKFLGIAEDGKLDFIDTPCKFTLGTLKNGENTLLYRNKYYIVEYFLGFRLSDFESNKCIKIDIELIDFHGFISKGTSAIIYESFMSKRSDRVCRVCFFGNDRFMPKERELLEQYCLFPCDTIIYKDLIIDEYVRCLNENDSFELKHFFKKFLKLFEAVEHFEQIGFHHGDLSSANIVYDTSASQFKIIDLDYSFFVDKKDNKNNNYAFNELVMNVPAELNIMILKDYSNFEEIKPHHDTAYLSYFEQFNNYPEIKNIVIGNITNFSFENSNWEKYFKSIKDVYSYVNCYQLCISFAIYCARRKIGKHILTYFILKCCDFKSNGIMSAIEIKNFYIETFIK